MLREMTSVQVGSRRGQQAGSMETAQLLIIVSDGCGINREGVETVKQAVRQARQAHVFIAFVIVDNPDNKVCIKFLKA